MNYCLFLAQLRWQRYGISSIEACSFVTQYYSFVTRREKRQKSCLVFSLSPYHKNIKIPLSCYQCGSNADVQRAQTGSGIKKIVLPSHYHPLPRQRLFFERFAFDYSRSVVWLEPHGCLAIGERLKGCHFTPRRTALIPQQR